MGRVLGLVACLIGFTATTAAMAGAQGVFMGGEVGWSEPMNKNYRGHVRSGFTINPYAGYMFTRYIGAQAGVHFFYQTQDNHQGDPAFIGQSRQETTMLGGTVGPRANLPLEDIVGDTPFLEDLVLYATAQGGYYVGLSGRLSQSAPGFFIGGGLGYQVTDELTIGTFGRWNRAYMGPRPIDLGPGQVPDERESRDIRWASYGLAANYQFPAPEPQPEPPAPPVVSETYQVPTALPPPTRRKIVLRSVYFEFDKSVIRPDAAPVLDEAAGLLRDQGDINIIAEGHTDSIGTDAYNMALGHRRANAVRAYLINRGIIAKRISTESYGESRPVATNETPEGRAQNRRVELRVEEIGR